MDLVLASTSAYRAQLLTRLGLPFVTAAPDTDETPEPGESPVDLVRRLALAKATSVASHREAPALVIGSDQVAVLGDLILGKPGTVDAACTQLQRLSGQEVMFQTGLCLLNTATGTTHVTNVGTPVRFRQLTDAEIRDYVACEMPLDCAGAFKSEGLGIALFEHIRGDDPNALIGLPLIELCRLLAVEGMPVLGQRSD